MKYRRNLKEFPPEIVADLLFYQVMQGNPLDISVFEDKISTDFECGGFDWSKSDEGHLFWCDVLVDEKFDVYFKRFPKDDK